MKGTDTLLPAFLLAALAATAVHAKSLTTAYAPTSGTDKARLAQDIGLAEADIVVDRRCVYARGDTWTSRLPSRAFRSCVLVVTPTSLILAEDSDGEHFKRAFVADVKALREVSLREDLPRDAARFAGGKAWQLQFMTGDGYFSVTAFRSNSGAASYDERGAVDAYETLKREGAATGISPGRVETEDGMMWFYRSYRH